MTVITDAMRAQIGVETAPYSLRIETEDLLRFARMIEAHEPWLVDEKAAASTRFRGIVAAPTYLIVMREIEARALAAIDLRIPLAHGVDGGSAWDYFEPVRPGDTITAVARLVSYTERATSLGETLFQLLEITYRNQRGQLAVRQRDTRIFYP